MIFDMLFLNKHFEFIEHILKVFVIIGYIFHDTPLNTIKSII